MQTTLRMRIVVGKIYGIIMMLHIKIRQDEEHMVKKCDKTKKDEDNEND